MSEDRSIYDRLTTPTGWPNPAPFVPMNPFAAAAGGDRMNEQAIKNLLREGETQWEGKYDDPDAKPDDERWEPGKRVTILADPELASLKDRILDAARADDESAVITKHLAAERAECEHIALFTLRDSLTEDGTTPEQVESARLILRYLLETR